MTRTRLTADGAKDRGRVLLLGEPGSGKTTLAGSVAEMGKTLLVYCIGEEGTSSLHGEPWADNIDLQRLDDPTQIRDIYHELLAKDHGYDALVLDGVAALHAMWMRYLLELPQQDIRDASEMDAFMDMREWGRLKEITMDVMTSLYSLASHAQPSPVHVVMASQVKVYDQEADEGTVTRLGADVSAGCRTAVHSTPDHILYCEAAENPDEFDAPAMLRVRVGRHDRITTKTHTPFATASKLPATLGDHKTRLTMKRFFKLVGIPTT